MKSKAVWRVELVKDSDASFGLMAPRLRDAVESLDRATSFMQKAVQGNDSAAAFLAPIRQVYAGLAPRERRLVAIAAGAVVVVLLLGLVSLVRSTRAGLESRIAAKEKDLAGIQELRDTYLMLRNDTERLYTDAKTRPADFSLFSFLEGIGSRAMPREKITAMSPSNLLRERKSSKTRGSTFSTLSSRSDDLGSGRRFFTSSA